MHTSHRSAALALIPYAFLMLVVAGYTVSECTDRYVLVEGSVLLLLVLPVLWLFGCSAVRICDGFVGRWLGCAILLLLYLAAVQGSLPAALPCGWWRFTSQCAALASILFVVISRSDARERIRYLGSAAACALLVCVVMNLHLGLLQPLNTGSFGFGHINILANTAGPSLIVWTVLLAYDWWHHRRPRLADSVLLTIGLACLVIIAVATHRRGLLLGAGLAGTWVGLTWLWYRSKQAALCVGLVGLLLAIALVGHLLRNDMPTVRDERVRIYRSAVEGIIAGLPFGFGRFGALHLQTVEGGMSRHMTADGGYGTHVHNEFLDIGLDGGPIAACLFVVLVAMLGYRLLHIRDPALRVAYQAMAAAIMAHLLTDNVYGTEVGVVWLAIVCGMMLTAPVAGPALAPLRVLPPVRLLIAACAAVSVWGAYRDLPSALLPRQCDAQAQMRCALSVLEPQSLDMHAEAALTGNPPLSADQQKEVIEDQQRKGGLSIRLLAFRSIYDAARGSPEQVTQDYVRLLRLNPFGKPYYSLLGQILAQHPQCAADVPRDIQRRISYLSGLSALPAPNLNAQLASIDDGADAYAGIIWTIANDRPWAEIDAPLASLCRTYGDIQDVAQLVFQAAISAPPGSFPWLKSVYPVLEYGLRNPGIMGGSLAQVQTATQAQIILPLLDFLYPTLMAECRAGHQRDPKQNAGDFYVSLARITRLAQTAGIPAHQ